MLSPKFDITTLKQPAAYLDTPKAGNIILKNEKDWSYYPKWMSSHYFAFVDKTFQYTEMLQQLH